MRIPLLTFILFCSINLLGQKKAASGSSTVIEIVPGIDTIESLKANDPGLRTLILHVKIKAQEPAKNEFKILLLNYNHINSNPTLIDSTAIITKNSFQYLAKDSGKWRASAYFTINLKDSAVKDETFFIIKEGSVNNVAAFVIHPSNNSLVTIRKNVNDSENQPVSVVTAKTPTASVSHVRLDNGSSFINPIYTKDSIRDEKIVVTLTRDTVPVATDTDKISYTINKYTFPFVPKFVSNKDLTIIGTDWNKDSSGSKIVYFKKDTITIQNQTIKDTLKRDLSATIQLAGNAKSYHEISLTEKNSYNPNKPFWVEIGTNFDFADGLQPNNFFGGVFLNKKEMRPFLWSKSTSKTLGLFTGVYESKSITNSNTLDSSVRQYYNANSLALIRNDSVATFRDTGKAVSNTVVKIIGLFFSPQIRLTNGSANEDGFHVFASLWMELQWQRISLEIDYSNLVRKDTIFVPANSVGQYSTSTSSILKDIRSHYFGFGLPIYFKEGNTNAFFNPIIGLSNQPPSNVLNDYLKLKDMPLLRQWKLFYIFQFRLNEEHFGIAFTGEVRGLLEKNSPPLVSLALSKKFDLDKFLEFK